MSKTPRVLIDDAGVDAVFVEPKSADDGGVLIVRPGQSLESAIAASAACLPHIHRDRVRELLHGKMPNTAPFESLLLDPAPRPDASPGRVDAPLRRTPLWARPAALVMFGAAAGVAFAVGAYSVLMAAGVFVPVEQDPPSAFDSTRFEMWEHEMGWTCTSNSDLTAQCATDGEGYVQASASVMSSGLLYRFGWLGDDVMVATFESTDRAEGFAASGLKLFEDHEDAERFGRFVVWGGTEQQRIKVWNALDGTGALDLDEWARAGQVAAPDVAGF